jgi:hypothetical protein
MTALVITMMMMMMMMMMMTTTTTTTTFNIALRRRFRPRVYKLKSHLENVFSFRKTKVSPNCYLVRLQTYSPAILVVFAMNLRHTHQR